MLFRSLHRRAFAVVFTVAPIEAVTRFVTRMRTNALHKMAKTLHIASGTWNDEVVPATENERLGTFRSIAGGIENAARRDYVTGLYGLS